MRIDCAGLAGGVVLSCLLVGCGGRGPEEVEAERARANAEWNTQAAIAEGARQAEETRMVQEELAVHRQHEQAEEQRENERRDAERAAERDRLMKQVAAKFPDPDATRFTGVHWNDANSVLCGSIGARAADGTWPEPVAFITSGDSAVLDSAAAADHDRFLAAAQDAGCSP